MLTVADIIRANKEIERVAKYMDRYIKGVNVAQVNSVLEEAKKNIRAMAIDFARMNIADLRIDDSDLRRRIGWAEDSVREYEREVEHYTERLNDCEEDDRDWLREELGSYESCLQTAQEELEALQEELDELMA